MEVLGAIAKSLSRHGLKTSKHLYASQLLSYSNRVSSPPHQHFAVRNLILESSAQTVQLSQRPHSDSGIFELKLDRGESKNAIGKIMLRELRRALEILDDEKTAKVTMICSSIPGIFCAGADLKERKTMSPPEVREFVNNLRSTFSFLEALHCPTIAIIEGAALGGGLELAMSCDLRICGEDAVMGLPETGLAIIPGAGGTQRLPRLVGKSAAKELIFTGRKISGKEAASLGLVNYCVPTGEAYSKAEEIAHQITLKGPLALRMAKRAIDKGSEMDMTSALAFEEDCYEELLHTNDRLEGLAAFAEKRRPVYRGH